MGRAARVLVPGKRPVLREPLMCCRGAARGFARFSVLFIRVALNTG